MSSSWRRLMNEQTDGAESAMLSGGGSRPHAASMRCVRTHTGDHAGHAGVRQVRPAPSAPHAHPLSGFWLGLRRGVGALGVFRITPAILRRRAQRKMVARASPSEQGSDGAAPPRWAGQVPDSDDIMPDKDALSDRIKLLVSDCKKAGIKQCAPVPKPFSLCTGFRRGLTRGHTTDAPTPPDPSSVVLSAGREGARGVLGRKTLNLYVLGSYSDTKGVALFQQVRVYSVAWGDGYYCDGSEPAGCTYSPFGRALPPTRLGHDQRLHAVSYRVQYISGAGG